MLARVRNDGLFGRDFGSGFWLWNGLAGCYTFLPFYESWRSPYGFGYNTFFGCYGCGYGYVGSGGTGSGTPYPGTSGGGGSSSGGNTSGGTPAPVVSRPEPPPMRSEPSPPPPRESAPSAPSPLVNGARRRSLNNLRARAQLRQRRVHTRPQLFERARVLLFVLRLVRVEREPRFCVGE